LIRVDLYGIIFAEFELNREGTMMKFLKLVYIWGGWGLASFLSWSRTGKNIDILICMIVVGIVFGFLTSIDILQKNTSGS
jgi:hypothetical protein